MTIKYKNDFLSFINDKITIEIKQTRLNLEYDGTINYITTARKPTK